MSPKSEPELRTCPGERYSITLPICRTRQRNQYPKCLLCEHRSAEVAGSAVSDPKVPAAVFRRSGVLGEAPGQINEYVIRKVGVAAAQFLRAEVPSGARLVVACDARENSRSFMRIFCEGAARGGMGTVNVGSAPPELLAFVLGTDGCTGAAFIGAGNHADNVNGVRIWRGDLSPVVSGTGLEKIALIARRLRSGCSRLPGEMGSANPLPDYVAYVRKLAPQLGRLRVAVDGGCGAGGRTLKAIFAELPVELIPAHFAEDGRNQFLGKGFPSNALLASMRTSAREEQPDFGAALDFSGERIAFFDEKGALLPHDVAAGLIATELLARSPGARICCDVRASAALRGRVARCEGQSLDAPASPLAFARHFRRSDALYGADLSGTHYFKDFFRFPSPFVALLLLCAHVSREGRPVSALAAELDTFSRSGEVAISVPSPEAAQKVLAGVRDEYREAETEMVDGLTVRCQDWWFNLRQPGEAAELRLNVEGKSRREQRRGRQSVERLISRLLSAVRT
ncbi:MAG: hypothetical protein ACYS1C_02190 [Planctomycetota bacterium]